MKITMTNPFTEKSILVADQEGFDNALLNGYIDIESELREDGDGSDLKETINPIPEETTMEITNILDIPETPPFTKDNILVALEDINVLNAALSQLGDLQTADEIADGKTSHLNGEGFSAAFARTGQRLWMWVTGKDPKTMETKWDPKCLSHNRANAAFTRQLNNYDEFTTAVELARHVAGFHWCQLENILEPGFKGTELPKADKKVVRKASPNWTSLTGAKVLMVKGGGTQLLWDSRKVWLPTSQIKTVSGQLRIPTWLAQKNDMI
jgi:hypothetical protein